MGLCGYFFLKAAKSFAFILFLSLLISCTTEPPLQEPITPVAYEPYNYRPPSEKTAAYPAARLKSEGLAESYINRLRPNLAGIVVMQHEKLVLKESFSADTADYVCVDPLFPPYVGALLGRMYKQTAAGPYLSIPLSDYYPSSKTPSLLAVQGQAYTAVYHQASDTHQRLERLLEEHTGYTMGMAAEELVFEPLEIDDYQWKEGNLCLPPFALLQLSSLYLRNGRWGNSQFLSPTLTQSVLSPAYTSIAGKRANGWQYYRLRAKGRKQPLLYWEGGNLRLFLLPELEAVILLETKGALPADSWDLLQQYMIPALMP